MFHFSQQLIEECRKQYFDEYGIGLTAEQAEAYLHDLVDLFDYVTQESASLRPPFAGGEAD